MIPQVLTCILLLFFASTINGQECLPELARRAESRFSGRTSINLCPNITETSDVIVAAVEALFSPNTTIPNECTTSVTWVECTSTANRRRGRGPGRRGGGDEDFTFQVDVQFKIKINCSSDPCIVNGSTNEDDMSTLMTQAENIDNLFEDVGKTRRIKRFIFGGVEFRVRSAKIDKGFCALCGDMVVAEQLRFQSKTDETSKGSGSKFGRKGRRPKGRPNPEDTQLTLCGKLQNYVITQV